MANIASNRSPSPLSSRNCRNSETNSTTRRSFSGNPFARPNALINPKGSNPATPANTPTTTDHTKRNLVTRKSTGSCSMFQDGKENLKDSLRSPAKSGSKNFMSPTISAASKFTPSPRKKILGEKNDLTRTSIQFLNKDSDFKSESESTTSNQTVESTTTVEQKVTFVDKVTLISANDENENENGNENENENSDLGKIRAFYCSPITSPIIAPIDADPHVPPYDPKNNFLSPRPQYLRYKPNPRIESLLNKDDYGEDDDVTGLQDSFNLSDEYSSESEEEQEQEQEKEELEGKEAEFGGKQDDSVNGSLDDLSEIVSEEKKSVSEVRKPSNKTLFFKRSKTVTFLFVMFVIACFSVSFTDLPPMDLPIYNDINYSEIYHESLKFAEFAKESFDGLVENVKQLSIDFVSYLSYQKSHFFPTHNISPIQFFNLTNPSVQEDFVFNRNVGTDYIQEIQEFDEEMENMVEETYQEMDFNDEIYVEDEVVTEEQNEIQIDGSEDGLTESKSNLEDGFVSKSESGYGLTKEQNEIQIDGSEEGLTESKSNLEDGFVSKSEIQTETEVKDTEIESSLPASSDESETLTSVLTKSINTINLVVGLSMVILAATATSAIFYMNKSKLKSKVAKISVNDDCSSETSSSVQKSYNKKNNNRESMASSSSDFSMGSPSYGSFTTFERIPIKHGDEVMLTPIRRSSRLRKNKVISS